MENILLYIVTFFFIIGAIDYFEGNRFKLGKSFEDGVKTIGPLAISMIGILSLTPLISDILNETLVPLARSLAFDPSTFPSSFIAIDMGAYNIAQDIANTSEMAKFSGVLMASTVGCTLSFTLPLALGIIKENHIDTLTKGLLCGIITLPIALVLGGVLLKINLGVLIYNLIPMIILSIILAIGIFKAPKIILFIFRGLGKVILFISIIGLIAQGIYSIVGIKIIDNLMSLSEALTIVGKIGLFLGGAYVMLEYIKIILKNPLKKLSQKLDMNESSITAFLGSFASAIIVFSEFEKLDRKGQVVCSAFAVGGAYLFGGQLGYVVSVESEMIGIYLIVKATAGLLAIILAAILLKIESKNEIN